MSTEEIPPISIDLLLDTQLLDPWSEDPEGIPGLGHFKRLIREDYPMAEALWAGVFCSLGVGIGMQLVRAYITASAAASLMAAEADMLSMTEVSTGYILGPAAAADAATASYVAAAEAAEVMAALVGAAFVST